jgi:hypothetical protein
MSWMNAIGADDLSGVGEHRRVDHLAGEVVMR